MTQPLTCANCREEITPEDTPIRHGDIVYCCEACAFEAERSVDCSGKTSSYAKPVVEPVVEKEDKSSQ